LVGCGHVRHQAASGEVWRDDFLVRRAQDIGAPAMKCAAEHDELGLAAAGRRADCFNESPV
jgi:hypothetical protein